MKNNKVIVTLAIGGRYYADWKRVCESNWKTYADKYGYDILCISQPLDISERAQQRSVAWQKCLILGRKSLAQDYERVVWVDSDIVFNNRTAPDVTEGVPLAEVGGAEDINGSQAEPLAARRFLERSLEYWPDAVINWTPNEYYTQYGLSPGVNRVVNTGVLVLSPTHHRHILENVYATYEEKGGREWHMEMRPLSYELVKAQLVHWIDPRFNLMWPYLELLHYPFLLHSKRDHRWADVIKKHLGRLVGLPSIRKSSINAAFQNSFFLHFGGTNTSDMEAVNQQATSWLDY